MQTKLQRAVKAKLKVSLRWFLHGTGWFLLILASAIAFVGWWEVIT